MARDAVDHAARVAGLPVPSLRDRLAETARLAPGGPGPGLAPRRLRIGPARPETLAAERPSGARPFTLPCPISPPRSSGRSATKPPEPWVTSSAGGPALFLDARASLESAPRVAELMAAELGRDGSWQSEQVARFKTLAEASMMSAFERPSQEPYDPVRVAIHATSAGVITRARSSDAAAARMPRSRMGTMVPSPCQGPMPSQRTPAIRLAGRAARPTAV